MAWEESPFPLLVSIFSPATLTQVGYQDVGMKPLLSDDPGLDTSNTARQLLSALAMKRVLSSFPSARLFVVEPAGELG